jgi:periplasmic divalent cation tolerance protein
MLYPLSRKEKSMQEEMIIVVSNMPNAEVAQTIARDLVEKHLAACVNILPGVNSVYRWQGAVEEASEVTVLIKTRHSLYASVEAAITALHPYDVPEILALPISSGLPAYVSWMVESTELK